MPDLKSELAKIGKHAGPSTSCDARPSSDKRERKSRMVPAVNMTAYVHMVGRAECAEQMGLTQSGVGTILNRNECSPMYEKFAEALIREIHRERSDDVSRPTLFAATVPADKVDAFCTLSYAMKISVKVLDVG